MVGPGLGGERAGACPVGCITAQGYQVSRTSRLTRYALAPVVNRDGRHAQEFPPNQITLPAEARRQGYQVCGRCLGLMSSIYDFYRTRTAVDYVSGATVRQYDIVLVDFETGVVSTDTLETTSFSGGC